jgi:glycopeptide antibiotics resistance protein
MLQINKEKQLFVAKKILVLLPAIFIILIFGFEYLRTHRPLNSPAYTLNSYLNVFPYVLFVFWSGLEREQKTVTDVVMQTAFNIYVYVIFSLTIIFIPIVGIFNAMITGLWFEHIILMFINYFDFGVKGVLTGTNFIPFQTILGSGIMDRQVLGNLMLFFPLAFFLVYLYEVKDMKKFMGISFMISVIIEITQFVFSQITPWVIGGYARSFDVDDILLNVAGAAVGYLVFIAIQKELKKKKITIPGISVMLEEENPPPAAQLSPIVE